MVLVTFRIQIHMFWIFVLWLMNDQSLFMALFVVFKLWIGPGFIFKACS